MAIPEISLQLYSVRDRARQDYEGTMRAIAAMGFRNVEPAGFPGTTPEAAAALFRELGLAAPSCHGPLPVGEDAARVIETAQALGHRYLITGCPAGFRENYTSRDAVLRMAESYCAAAEIAGRHGMQVGYHNHDWDLVPVDGTPAYRIFLANTPDTVLYEADLFWAARAGLDVAALVREIGVRGRCLHFKDGVVRSDSAFTEAETEDGRVMVSAESPFLPAGRGGVALDAASAAAVHAEYVVVELDSYSGDIMQAVAESYAYLTGHGIARGAQ